MKKKTNQEIHVKRKTKLMNTKIMKNVLLSVPPIQASSAGTAHLKSAPRYKPGCK